MPYYYPSQGILFGQGRPKTVAIIGITCSWIVSLPLAYTLAFPANLRLRGLWYDILTKQKNYRIFVQFMFFENIFLKSKV